MTHARRLTLAHLWVAFAAFAVACVLGVWQMWARSPLPAPFLTAHNYFTSVTAHGVFMAYVLTTFMVMGFGYYVAETALKRPLPYPHPRLGRLRPRHRRRRHDDGDDRGRHGDRAVHLLSADHREPLFLHRPRAGGGGLLDLVRADDPRHARLQARQSGRAGAARHVRDRGQCGDVAVDHRRGRRRAPVPGHPGGLRLEPRPSMSDCRARCSRGRCTRSSISGCFPAYIAFYTMAPQAAGGRLYWDTMGRLTFILFLIYSLPVGMHHLFMDPQQSMAFKFLQMSFTALVAAPTLLTVFTITASMEIAGRLRGGRGLVRLDRRAALGPADGARHRPGLLHAVVRRRRRAHQHELRHERHGPQHLVGDGAFPSHLRRHRGDHVFRHRLRDLADADRPFAGFAARVSACSSGCGSSA